MKYWQKIRDLKKHRTSTLTFNKSDFLRIAKEISLIENGKKDFSKTVFKNKSNHTVAITGGPGVGKSTLLNLLVNESLKDGKSVAVLVLDPQSSISGGSFLGDRVRLNLDYPQMGVFIRSITFGLNQELNHMKILSVINLFKILDFDHIYLETIGAEQNNMDISQIADVVISVLVPEEQDWVQILKSDNLDMAHLIFINKSDLIGQPGSAYNSNIRAESREYFGNKDKVIEGSARKHLQILELYNQISKELRNEIGHES
jgi:LAO/AO transport system kinase